MAIPQTYKQYGQIPFFYANGLGISNDATTPDSKLVVGTGTILDSTQTFQLLNLASITVDATVTGLNGIDTGVLAASKLYAVHLIADPVTNLPTGAMISLSATAPLLPFGYSAFALIGYIATDSSTDFLLGYWTAGNDSRRTFVYDAPQATAVTAGAETTYTGVALTTLVPAVDNTPVSIHTLFNPNAASDTLNLQGFDSTGDAVLVIGQVATVDVSTLSTVMAQLNTAAPSIKYKVSSASAAVAINVAGYDFFI